MNKTLKEESVSGRLALDWNISEDVLGYVSYSRGFKSGSFPTIATSDEVQLNPVVQEQLDAYEIGAKMTLLDGAAQLNAATFYYDYTDKQLLTRVPTIFGALSALQNIPESKVIGAELDFQWSPAEGLFVSLGASYANTEVKDFIGTTQLRVEGSFDGSDFPLTPEVQAFALVNYDWSISDNLNGFVGADLSYTDKSFGDYSVSEVVSATNPNAGVTAADIPVGSSFDVPEVFVLDSYTLLGARVGIRSADDSWSVMLWGRNLTDEDYRTQASKAVDGVVAWTGMPRTFGVTFKYNFL